MSHPHPSRCVPVLLSCLFAPWLFAQATTEPSSADLARQVDELRAEVQDLRARLNSSVAATQPATGNVSSMTVEELDRRMKEAIDDHDKLDAHAGWDPQKGFIIRSDDDSFLLHPWAFVQVRNATTYRNDASGPGDQDTDNGFELPRAKFILDGNLVSKDLTYQFIWATSDTTGNLGLQDGWARYHFANTPYAVEAGQIRNPVDHEQLLFATKSLTPDRSIVNNVLLNGDDIVKGVELSYGYDQDATVRGEVAFTSGQRNFDTDFEEYPTNTANWGAAGRVEWKLLGDWADYQQFSAIGNKSSLMVLGAGFDYTEAGAAAAFTHVADLQYDTLGGTSVYLAYLGRYTRADAGAPTTNGQFTSTSTGRSDTYDATVRFMVAQLLQQRFEPFFRYEYLQFDPHEFTSAFNPTVHDFTLGANYYFFQQRAKISGAASYLPNGSPVQSTISDLLTSHRGEEIIIQIQFQLMI